MAKKTDLDNLKLRLVVLQLIVVVLKLVLISMQLFWHFTEQQCVDCKENNVLLQIQATEV